MKPSNRILVILAVSLIITFGCISVISKFVQGQDSNISPAFGKGQFLMGNGTWAIKSPMLTKRCELAIGVVNDKIYAIGGVADGNYLNTNEEYDPATNTWVSRASMPTPRANFAIGVVNGKIYAIGGNNNIDQSLNVVEEYNPVTDDWTVKAPMPTARTMLAIGVVNNLMYAIGGGKDQVGSFDLDVNEEYNPIINTWATRAPMVITRTALAIGVVNEKIYAIGGAIGGYPYKYLNASEEYDSKTNTWKSTASMPTNRVLAIGVVNQKIYAIGGYNGNAFLNTTEEYDPINNVWINKASMPTARSALSIGVVNQRIYAIGGLFNTLYLNITEEYDLSDGNNPPGAPLNLQAIAGDKKVHLLWTASFNNGGSPIIAYRIYRGTLSGGETYLIEVDNMLTYTDLGLINGQTYYYRVSAVNLIGEGPKSNEAKATPFSSINIAPWANFTFLPLVPTTDDMVQFTDSSSDQDGTIISWIWDFGDGIKSTVKNPSHRFTITGDYSVKLNVTDDQGASMTIIKKISVIEPSIKNSEINTTIFVIIFILIDAILILIFILLRKRWKEKEIEKKK